MKRKMFKTMGISLLLIVACAMLVGCQEKKVEYTEPAVPGFTYENYDRIVVGNEETGEGGMVASEVNELLDREPTSNVSMQVGDKKSTQTQWIKDGNKIEVFYVNDLVASKGQSGLDEK